MVMVLLIGLAKYVDERAHRVKPQPAHIQPVEARWHGPADEIIQNQVRAGAHQQAREGDELEAIKGRRAVQFGVVHGRNN